MVRAPTSSPWRLAFDPRRLPHAGNHPDPSYLDAQTQTTFPATHNRRWDLKSASATTQPAMTPWFRRPNPQFRATDERLEPEPVLVPRRQQRNQEPVIPAAIKGNWPADGIPTEIFEFIGSYLSRDDLLRMRLVNKDFELKISSRVFKNVVIPFEPDIYSMTGPEIGKIDLNARNKMGKRKAKGRRDKSDVDTNTIRQPVADGMGFFRSWGDKIRKFAITFDFDEGKFISCKQGPPDIDQAVPDH